MVQARAGTIRFGGEDIANRPPTEVLKRGIGYVPQGRCNFPAMSVEENLEMGAYLRRDARVRGDIEALFVRFPILATKRRDPAGTLSGGQQQILEMAIALLLHPRVLMVDEPSLGLDPRMVELVFDTLVAMNREGTTVLMVEQNAKKALAVSDRGFVLELGRNRFDGTGRELLDNPDVRNHYLGGRAREGGGGGRGGCAGRSWALSCAGWPGVCAAVCEGRRAAAPFPKQPPTRSRAPRSRAAGASDSRAPCSASPRGRARWTVW